jgi:plastocyanin
MRLYPRSSSELSALVNSAGSLAWDSTNNRVVVYNGTSWNGVASSSNYPAITSLDVTASGSSAYLFNNQYSGNNPTIYAISGTTIAFNLLAGASHPFQIRTALSPAGTAYSIGLIHVSATGEVTTGSSAQGKTSGVLYWQVPASLTGDYAYQCTNHSAMQGLITIKSIASL